MKNIVVVLVAAFSFIGCKKDLVDTAANQIEDLTSLTMAKDKTATGVNVIFFHASWCKVCKEQRPAFESASQNPEVGSARFYEVEYDDHKDITEHFNITGFPTIVLISNGKEVKRFSGKGHSENDIISAIKNHL